ncbi:MAG: ADP-ribosylglycohydrolase family protein, partial [Spirochaetota bacterium]
MKTALMGAIAGDVMGSVYERSGIKRKDIHLFHRRARPTDDTVLTLAVARAIVDADGAPAVEHFAAAIRELGRRYPNAGYGGSFRRWLEDDRGEPYGSWGNGSAMRSSAVGWAYDSVEEVLRFAERSALPTHDHPEGVKGAQAVALAVLLAGKGASREELRDELSTRFGYDLARTVDEIRPGYGFEVSCQKSVPEAIIAFLDSNDFEDAIRNAISLGGDADTQACIAGAVAEAFYGGVPSSMVSWVLSRLDDVQLGILQSFSDRYLPSYRIVVHGATMDGIARYATRIGTGTASPGARLARELGGATRSPGDEEGEPEHRRRVTAELLLQALLNTKRPCIFAESEVVGDGRDWTPEELSLLGDIGVAVPVTVFDDGRHRAPGVHDRPIAGTLLFIPGALLRSDAGATPADWDAVVRDGGIDQDRFTALYERRLLPLLKYAANRSRRAGRQALVTIPGLGCGQFAGPFRGRLGARLREALRSILERHEPELDGLRAVWFDPYDECENERP